MTTRTVDVRQWTDLPLGIRIPLFTFDSNKFCIHILQCIGSCFSLALRRVDADTGRIARQAGDHRAGVASDERRRVGDSARTFGAF